MPHASCPRRLVLSAVLVLMLACAPLAHAFADKESPIAFRIIDVDFADTTGTTVTGSTPNGTLVGIYQDAGGSTQGFVRRPHGDFRTLLGVIPQDISAAGITGIITLPNFDSADLEPVTTSAGFVFQDGTLRLVRVPTEMPGMRLFTEAIALNDAGVVVGDARGADGIFRGFRFEPDPPTYTTIEVPGAQSTALTGITEAGVIVGNAVDAAGQRLVFRWDNGTFTFLTIPDLPAVDLAGMTEAGVVAGNAGSVGFTYDGTTVRLIEVPGAQITELFGIRDGGTVYGRFLDAAGANHGFVATQPWSQHGWRSAGGWSRKALDKMQVHTFQATDCVAGSKRRVCRGR